MPFWHYIAPQAATNLVANPSGEYNATGWAGTAGGTATRQAGTAAFGAWAIAGTVGAAAGTGVTFGTVAIPAAGSYTVSAYVYGGSGSVYSFGLKGTGAGAAFTGSAAITTGGSWARYSVTVGEAASINRLVALVNRSAGGAPFLIDGVQVESGTTITTYVDGDQDGCTWLGAPHASSSARSGTSRQGGAMVSLQSLGLTVLEQGGAGLPPVANITQEYAVAAGGIWQRQRAQQRVFTVTGLMSGTTWQGLHAIRQTVIDAVKVNATANPQPVRFLYTGAGGTTAIDAYYDGGLGFESRNGFTETAALRFLAPDPFWFGVTDQGTQLAPQVNLGSVNFFAYRDSAGRWGTLGANGTTLSNAGGANEVRAMTYAPEGTLYFGGVFSTIGGNLFTNSVGFYAGGVFGTLTGGTLPANDVFALERNPAGTLFVGGAFVTAGGTRAVGVAQHVNGAWGTLTGGSIASGNQVRALDWAPTGTLFVGGDFSSVAGSTAQGLAQWTGAWGTLAGGTVNVGVAASVRALAFRLAPSGTAGTLFIGGDFTAAGGTTAYAVAYHAGGAFGTLNTAMFGAQGSVVYALGFDAAQTLIAGGNIGTAGGNTVRNVAQWNDVQWSPLGGGVGGTSAQVLSIVSVPSGLLLSGRTWSNTAGGVPLPDDLAVWNGATFIPLDIDLPSGGVGTVRATYGQGTIWLGGGFVGTATAASVATLQNTGAADATPVVVFRNTGASNARIYQVLNTTTGDGVWLNVYAQPGETITLDLRNSQKTLTSNVRGNLLGLVLPGSNLTTWRLSPGANTVSAFADSAVEVSIYWRPRAWSQDDVL